MLTVDLLNRLSKECGGRPSRAVVQGIVDNQRHLEAAGIFTRPRLAEWAAQACIETNYFGTLKELGGASYFKRYEGRADLGNTKAGDGLKYPGRGVFQITGRDNYDRYGKRIGVDLIKSPQLAERPDISVQTSALYWNDKGLSAYADRGDTRAISRGINRGNPKSKKAANHEAERVKVAKIAREVLGVVAPTKAKTVGLISQPVAPADTAGPVYTDTHRVSIAQTMLRNLGYTEVGPADGKIGEFTKTAVRAYRAAKGLPDGDHIDDVLMAALATDNEPRVIAPERANASPAEVREKVPEVQATWLGKITSNITTAGSAVGAAVAAAWDNLGDAKGYLEPIKDFVGDVPLWLWLAALGGGAFILSRKFRRAEKVGTEAFQEGARR